jgi:hypothetical protein
VNKKIQGQKKEMISEKKNPVCTQGNSMKSNMQTKEVEIYLMQQVVDQHLLL